MHLSVHFEVNNFKQTTLQNEHFAFNEPSKDSDQPKQVPRLTSARCPRGVSYQVSPHTSH